MVMAPAAISVIAPIAIAMVAHVAVRATLIDLIVPTNLVLSIDLVVPIDLVAGAGAHLRRSGRDQAGGENRRDKTGNQCL